VEGWGKPRYLFLKEFEREYSIVRGDLARGIDPQLKTVAVDPETAKLIPSTLAAEPDMRLRRGTSRILLSAIAASPGGT
jgi:hypothetical protein